MELNSCKAEGGAGWGTPSNFSVGQRAPMSAPSLCEGIPACTSLPLSLLLSPGPGPGGLLHSHFPLPHAGGPVDSRSDTAGSSPRNSVLPVPQHHSSVGSPGEKLLQGHHMGLGVL